MLQLLKKNNGCGIKEGKKIGRMAKMKNIKDYNIKDLKEELVKIDEIDKLRFLVRPNNKRFEKLVKKFRYHEQSAIQEVHQSRYET